MHAYLTARGMPDFLNRWENDCLSRYLPFYHDYYQPPGSLQFSLRPVRIYDLVFPQRQYETAMSMVKPNMDNGEMNKMLWILRKILGAQKAAPWKYDSTKFIPRQNVTVNLIGTKLDQWKDGIEQI